jgi:hypothetical protein
MAIPTFDSYNLFTIEMNENFGSIEPRNYTESLPNVNGEFVQPTGNAGRTITAIGIAQYDTVANLKAAIRVNQQLANGRTVGDYVDMAGSTHETCILLSFTHGPIVPLVAGTVSFQCQCTATLRQLNPPVA